MQSGEKSISPNTDFGAPKACFPKGLRLWGSPLFTGADMSLVAFAESTVIGSFHLIVHFNLSSYFQDLQVSFDSPDVDIETMVRCIESLNIRSNGGVVNRLRDL